MKLRAEFSYRFEHPIKKKYFILSVLVYAIKLITASVWVALPLKASIIRMMPPFVDKRIIFPSGLNFKPVHSQAFSTFNRKEANGPLKHTKRGIKNCKTNWKTGKYSTNLVEWSKIIELDTFRVDSRSKDQAFGIECSHRSASEVHKSLAIRRPQIPKTQSFIEWSREEHVVYRRHG